VSVATEQLVRGLPKAELHLHIEGTLEPELAFELAGRNGIALRFGSVEELQAAYDFTDLQSLLDLYYDGAAVLCTEDNFRQLALAYLERAAADGVRGAEIFFDPQVRTRRGVSLTTVVDGLTAGLDEGRERFAVSSGLIPCFLRDLPPEEAMATLEEALPFADRRLGEGLDSARAGNPPSRLADLFARARAEALRAVAHAGEEGAADYVREALDELGAARIDHGVRATEDPQLVERLAREGIPLTVCPLSNVRLRVFDRLEDCNLPQLLAAGVRVTIDSDDPAYFAGTSATTTWRPGAPSGSPTTTWCGSRARRWRPPSSRPLSATPCWPSSMTTWPGRQAARDDPARDHPPAHVATG
jgi:adenosine deaminase